MVSVMVDFSFAPVPRTCFAEMARLSLQVTDNSREEVGNVANDDGNAGNGSTSSC